MFVEIDSSMNTGDICSAQFNHMPVLLPLFSNKLHRFSTTSLCLACLLRVVLMWTVAIFETEPGRQRLKEKKNHFKSELTSLCCKDFKQSSHDPQAYAVSSGDHNIFCN